MKRFSVFGLLALLSCSQTFNDADLGESGQTITEDASALDEALDGVVTARELGEAILSKGRAECSATAFSSCASSVRTRALSSCTRGSATWDGEVTLTFSDAACTMAHSGDTVTRTASLTVTGRRGATMTVNTAATTTWDGVSVGGGHKLTRGSAANTYTFEVLGITRAATIGSVNLFNVSRQSIEPVTVTGTSRNSRTADGGKIRAYHNLAEFNVDWVLSSVTWSEGCKCPTGGTMTGTLTGSKTGTVVITYTSCGSATLNKDGKSMAITTDSCESA